jgi:NDP-sugar pyrophosphorylase family protein
MIIRKQLFAVLSCFVSMSLLAELFPGLSNFSNSVLPTWENRERPWSVLTNAEGGLISQIEDLCGHEGIFIHPSAKIGEFVRIEGPCYVGKNAEIRHAALLRKGSWICDGSVVGHASEIKNSILLPGSKAPHFNYVGDSILGNGVNLGAGTKLSNVRNDRGSVPITNKNGERFDSGLGKLGAMIGDGSQLGCNVVTNPGAIISPGAMISPNETVAGWIS